jgi:hypothetical protein
MPRQYALLLWRKFSESRGALPEHEMRKLLEEAISFTQRALEIAMGLADEGTPTANGGSRAGHPREHERLLCINNLLYYRIDLARLRKAKAPRGEVAEIRRMTKELRRMIPGDGVITRYLLELDTLRYAHEFLGDMASARAVAAETAKALYEMALARSRKTELRIDEIREWLPRNLHDILDQAARLLLAPSGT